MTLTRKSTTETIKEALITVSNDLTIDGNVFNMLLNELESRLSEDDFISFCDGI